MKISLKMYARNTFWKQKFVINVNVWSYIFTTDYLLIEFNQDYSQDSSLPRRESLFSYNLARLLTSICTSPHCPNSTLKSMEPVSTPVLIVFLQFSSLLCPLTYMIPLKPERWSSSAILMSTWTPSERQFTTIPGWGKTVRAGDFSSAKIISIDTNMEKYFFLF